MHKHVPIARNMHILFLEQVVCKRSRKWKKSYLRLKAVKMIIAIQALLNNLAGQKITSNLFKEQRQKEAEKGCRVTFY